MRYVSTAIALAFFLVSTGALADARQHFMAGKDYYDQARYQQAIDEFEEAYRLDPRPLLLFNLAQAHEKLGNLDETVDYLKRFLESEPDTADRPALLNKIANIEARIAKTGIKVTSNEAEAAVFVDDKDHGKTPVTGIINLPEGQHKIKVVKKGFADFKIAVAVSSGQTTPVDVELEAGLSSLEKAVAAGEEPTKTEEKKEDGGKKKDGGGVEPLDVIPWAIAGVGAVTAVVGLGVIGGLAKANADHDKAVIADIVGWPGVALAVGGATWGLIRLTSSDDSEQEPSDAEVAVLPFIGPESGGFVAAIQF